MNVTDTAELVALRDHIFADILERPGKGYRKQLADYEEYTVRIEHLIEQYRSGMPLEETAADTNPALSDSVAGVYPVNPEQHSYENENPENENSEKDNPMIAYLALALGIIALVIAALPVLKKKEEQPSTDFQALGERMDELALRMKRLEQQATDLRSNDAVTTLTEIMESVEKRVVALENRSQSDTD